MNSDIEHAIIESGPAVLAYLRRLSQNEDRAQDLFQDVCIKALKAENRFIAPCATPIAKAVRCWLFKIARNTYFDMLKRSKHHSRFRAEVGHQDSLLDLDVPDQIAERREIALRILDSLSDTERFVVHQRFGLGRSFLEIADALGSSRGYVYRTMKHIEVSTRDRLR